MLIVDSGGRDWLCVHCGWVVWWNVTSYSLWLRRPQVLIKTNTSITMYQAHFQGVAGAWSLRGQKLHANYSSNIATTGDGLHFNYS